MNQISFEEDLENQALRKKALLVKKQPKQSKDVPEVSKTIYLTAEESMKLAQKNAKK